MNLLDAIAMDEEFEMFEDVATEGIKEVPGKVKAGVKAGAGAVAGGASAAKNDIRAKLDNKKTVELALTKAEAKLAKAAKKKNGVELLEQYEAQVKTESAKIAAAIKELSGLGKAVADGKMDKEAAQRRAKPIVKELAHLCSFMRYGTIIKDALAVTKDDLQVLTTYTKGLQALIAKYKAEAAKNAEAAKEEEPAAAAEESFDGLDAFLAGVCESFGPETDMEEDIFAGLFEEETTTAVESFDIDAFLKEEFAL